MKKALSAFLALFAASPTIHATTFNWSGYDWDVRTGSGEPGPNNWSEKNVWVDKQGYLNLRISIVDGVVSSASVQTKQTFKNGTYTWIVDGPVLFDENVVLGLFQYPAEQRQNGTNEIDIEIARWGDPKTKPLKYTVWPTQLTDVRYWEMSYELPPLSEYKFWYTRIEGTVKYDRWQSEKATSDPLHVMMNLWLFKGAQSYRNNIVVRIKSFTFTEAK